MSHSVVTNFDSYGVSFSWEIISISTYLRAGLTLKSPKFSSPADTKNDYPASVWQMEVFRVTPSDGGEYIEGRLFLKEYDRNKYGDGCWATVSASVQCNQYNSSNGRYYWSHLSSWPSQSGIPKCIGSDPIHIEKLANINGRNDSKLKIICSITVYMFNTPKNDIEEDKLVLARPSTTLVAPERCLGQSLDKARQNDLLTDVTLVTGEKEFKAHKVVLAAQSPFFKARFSERWEQSGERVELNDLSEEILKAVLTYVYTGKIDKINDPNFTSNLLVAANKYDLEKLLVTCEASLANSLSEENVVERLILADTHNGKSLRKLCISYIVKNPSRVKKSSGWSKLDSASEKLRLDVFKACFDSNTD